MSLFPPKLKAGDIVRVIAPSCSKGSMPWLNAEALEIARGRFEDELGLRVSFSKHIEEHDVMDSSSVQSRVEDLHAAFADPSVQMIIAVRGGWNANQLLRHIDWNLIKKNPKVFCGFSDITCLQNAIYAKTGLVTYSSPNYNTFGCKKGFAYALESFRRCLFSEESMLIEPSDEWSNDRWGDDQENRECMKNEGYWIMHEGEAEGTLLGGNLCTLNLLQGTEYMPDIRGSVLFLEDDYESLPHHFDRNLQSLMHQPGFSSIRGLVIGRFEKATGMTREILTHIIETKLELKNLPVIGNADFGHTLPMVTFPVGGGVQIQATRNRTIIEILQH